MPDSSHAPQRSNRMVSVCLDPETIDRLVERLSHSRGFYLKAAIHAMLPALEENYWTQQATTYEESIIDRRFRTIMDHALYLDASEFDSA